MVSPAGGIGAEQNGLVTAGAQDVIFEQFEVIGVVHVFGLLSLVTALVRPERSPCGLAGQRRLTPWLFRAARMVSLTPRKCFIERCPEIIGRLTFRVSGIFR